MRKFILTLVLLFGSAAITWAGQFTPKPPDRSATTDLPVSQHHRNVGGSDGAGLCVYTSVWHAALWADEAVLYGLRSWCESRPGGSYPEKLAQDITTFCKRRGLVEPLYVQHTGGDVAFLETALKTGRMVCITYSGRDDFYRGSISHMVNLVHLDANAAAILDNNRPGVFVWMTRADLLSRWKPAGWAVAFLRAPPPPYADGSPAPPCPQPQPAPPRRPWGEDHTGCSCSPCKCDPCSCELPTGGVWVGNVNGQEWGYWVGGKCVARVFTNGDVYHVDAGGNAVGQPYMNLRRPTNYGIDLERMPKRTAYYIAGTETSRQSALDALIGDGLVDDSDRWNLTVVDRDVPAVPAAYQTRLHVKVYKSGDWQVAQFRLKPGYTLRKPAVGRTGTEIGVVQTDGELADLLAVIDGKPWPPLPPPPEPEPEPEPEPAPPAPPVQPKVDLTVPDWVGGGVGGALLLWIIQRLKRKD